MQAEVYFWVIDMDTVSSDARLCGTEVRRAGF